ncbi:MAG: hypothetical protein RQ833_07470 [Sphingomonadaceae bacterium]|nr:hypothetical protein [Sphingomonadaceae bacterium]
MVDGELGEARQLLQRRGHTVYRASVDGGPADRWRVNRELLTDAELIARARRLSMRVELR